METEFKVGDRVKSGDKNIYEGNIVALCGDYAWVKYDSPTTWPDPMTESLTALTRIEPAAPKPKFRVGQRVRYGKGYGRILSLHTEAYVEVEDAPGTTHDPPEHAMWKVQNLEAVPEVWTTCGGTGKVGDGR